MITEPEILTAKTYFWRPAPSTSQRRSNENRRLQEVQDFLSKLPLKEKNIEVNFGYEESCNNVYKHLTIYKDSKKTNIKTLRRLYDIKQSGE